MWKVIDLLKDVFVYLIRRPTGKYGERTRGELLERLNETIAFLEAQSKEKNKDAKNN